MVKLLTAYAIAVLFVVLWIFAKLDDQQADRNWKARESILQARVAEAETQVRVDSVRVVQRVDKVRTLRDSLVITDTVAVREFIYQTDTLRENCLACVASAAEQRKAADFYIGSLQQELSREKKKSRVQRVLPVVAFVGGLTLGAWVRGK